MKLFSYLLFASLIIFSASCTKDDDDDGVNYGTPPRDTITIDSAWQFSMDVDDSTVTGVANDTSILGVWLNMDSVNFAPDTSYRNFNSSLMDINIPTPFFDVFHNGFKFVDFPEDSLVAPFFATGTYNFSTFNQPGFSIHWTDNAGTFWGTDLGVADQTGSEFTIDAVQEDTNSIDYTVKILAHFNCILYNTMNGETRTVTNGYFTGTFQNYW